MTNLVAVISYPNWQFCSLESLVVVTIDNFWHLPGPNSVEETFNHCAALFILFLLAYSVHFCYFLRLQIMRLQQSCWTHGGEWGRRHKKRSRCHSCCCCELFQSRVDCGPKLQWCKLQRRILHSFVLSFAFPQQLSSAPHIMPTQCGCCRFARREKAQLLMRA